MVQGIRHRDTHTHTHTPKVCGECCCWVGLELLSTSAFHADLEAQHVARWDCSIVSGSA